MSCITRIVGIADANNVSNMLLMLNEWNYNSVFYFPHDDDQ